MKESPEARKKSQGRAASSTIASVVTIAFYIIALAFAGFASVWFLCIRPPRSPEEFLLLWLILFLGGTTIYYFLLSRSEK